MSFLNDPTVEHGIDAEAPWDPYWTFALILLLASNKDGFSLKEKEDE